MSNWLVIEHTVRGNNIYISIKSLQGIMMSTQVANGLALAKTLF